MDELVQVTFPADGVAQLLQDTGPHNFSTFALNDQLLAALRRVREDGARVVVVGSATEDGGIGHGWLPDVVDTFTGGSPSGDPLSGWRAFEELDTGPMISIAAIDGPAWGHGAELAWACDLRVASRRSSFGQIEVNVGTIPGSGGTVRLARIAGEAVALGIVLDGRPVDGAEARRLGLVHRLVEPGRALEEAVGWATWLAGHPPWVLEVAKRTIKGAHDLSSEDALRRELGTFAEMLSRPDTLELVRAAQARYDAGADTPEAFGIDGDHR